MHQRAVQQWLGENYARYDLVQQDISTDRIYQIYRVYHGDQIQDPILVVYPNGKSRRQAVYFEVIPYLPIKQISHSKYHIVEQG